MMRVGLVVVVSLLLAGIPEAAHAQRRRAPAPEPAQAEPAPEEATPPDSALSDARTLFLQGQEAYQHGDYAAAVERWNAAYAIDARPALQYNLAQAYGRLGRLAEEMAALALYIESADPSDPLLAVARARVATLRERLARTSIRFEGGVAGAIVIIDGEERGGLPLAAPIAVEPGSHDIEVRAEGYRPFRSSAIVPPGEVIEVDVELVAITSAPVPTSAIALWATGGALLAGGGAVGLVAFLKADDGTNPDRAHAMALSADISMGIGAAAAITGLVLYLVRDDEAAEDVARIAITPAVTADSAGIGLMGRF